jgi:hypothetical protein
MATKRRKRRSKTESDYRHFLEAMPLAYTPTQIADAIVEVDRRLAGGISPRIVEELAKMRPAGLHAVVRENEELRRPPRPEGEVPAEPELGTCEDCRFLPASIIVPSGGKTLRVCDECYARRRPTTQVEEKNETEGE